MGRPPESWPPVLPTAVDDRTLLAVLRDERTVAAALAVIYQQHAVAVGAHLRRAGLDPELVEDAVQEAVITLWEGRMGLPEPLSIRAWLAVVASRRAIDWRRHQRPRPLPAAPISWPRAGADPAALILQQERGQQVRRLLALLEPDEQRLILLLSQPATRQAAVAAALQIAPTRLTSWLARIRRYLAAAWRALEAGDQPPPRRRLRRRSGHDDPVGGR